MTDADEITALRAENERLRADLRLAVTSDSEYCATLERINAALLAAPTVDISVVVPDRDYSTMTPKDCYEAGLLDGVYQAREAIKAAARAALEEKKRMSDGAYLESDADGCTICPKCDGRRWRAVKNPRLGPGIYEVVCDKCNGFGWVDKEHEARP